MLTSVREENNAFYSLCCPICLQRRGQPAAGFSCLFVTSQTRRVVKDKTCPSILSSLRGAPLTETFVKSATQIAETSGQIRLRMKSGGSYPATTTHSSFVWL